MGTVRYEPAAASDDECVSSNTNHSSFEKCLISTESMTPPQPYDCREWRIIRVEEGRPGRTISERNEDAFGGTSSSNT